MIALGKVQLLDNVSLEHVYNPWDIAFSKLYNETLTGIKASASTKNAIVVFTNNHVDVLIESAANGPLGSVYPFEVKLISSEKVSEFLSKDIKSSNGIIVPTQAAIDTYLFWNGNKYELVWTDEEP